MVANASGRAESFTPGIIYLDDISPNKYWGPISWNIFFISMPPFEKGGQIALHMSARLSVSLNLVQLITQTHFTPEASNLVGR